MRHDLTHTITLPIVIRVDATWLKSIKCTDTVRPFFYSVTDTTLSKNDALREQNPPTSVQINNNVYSECTGGKCIVDVRICLEGRCHGSAAINGVVYRVPSRKERQTEKYSFSYLVFSSCKPSSNNSDYHSGNTNIEKTQSRKNQEKNQENTKLKITLIDTL